MMPKLLTIIVPSYNMEKYLPKCLGSLVVAPALMERLEVLVVNDGSKDRTSEIAHEFAAKWSGTFKVIDKENGHYGSCVNAGLAVAQGVYVKILDADDTFDTANFCKYIEYLSSLTFLPDVVFTDYVQVDPDNHETAVCKLSLPQGEQFDNAFLTTHDYIAMHAITYRLSLLRDIGYRQTGGVAYTDTEWACRPMSYARSFCYYPLSVYRYLLGRSGQSVDRTVVAKGASQMVKVARSMITLYASDCMGLSVPGRQFYERSILRFCKIIYDIYLLKASYRACEVELAEFDTFLHASIPTIRGNLKSAMLPHKRGLKYVKIWCDRPALRRLVVFACRSYLWIRGSACE